MKSPVTLEQDLIEGLINRAWAKHGSDSHDGWENWVLEHWPHRLSFQYWSWLFQDLDKLPWINLWSPLTDRYEFWYWAKGLRHSWRWSFFEETKPERILCRFRGHPKGMIYYNPGGYEPDYRCKTCGEEIG